MVLNDRRIRERFHTKVLQRHHSNESTLVVDEFGLQHGLCRADIAVVNGHLIGYEIKSGGDSLRRLERQVAAYDAVFDYSSAVVVERHISAVEELVPEWWGLVLCTCGERGGIRFTALRRARRNRDLDPMAVGGLLWVNEVREVLGAWGVPQRELRQPRDSLYELLCRALSVPELCAAVRGCLKRRTGWRYRVSPSRCDDSCRPTSR